MEKKLVIRALLAFWQPAPTETHLFFTRGIGTHSITWSFSFWAPAGSSSTDGGVEDGQARPRPGSSKQANRVRFTWRHAMQRTYFSPPAAE